MAPRRSVRASALGWILRQAPSVLLPALVLASVGYAIHRERVDGEKAWRAEESARIARESARAAAWGALAGRGDVAASLASCREAWEAELGLHHDPVALAYTRDELTAYFLVGADRGSVRQVGCGAGGIRRGGRFAHPLHDLLPAEAPPRQDEDADDTLTELRRLASRTLDPGQEAIELVADPLHGRVLRRHWLSGQQGARAVVEPAGGPAFPLLVASPRLQVAAGAAPPALQPLQRQQWLAQPDAVFALLERQLPAGARVSELTLDDDRIELRIEASTPAFDGRPPVPFGDRSFDEYGVADTEWWYPREDAGFGCRTGQPLAAVRAAFVAARAGLGGRPLAHAWYSCSTAYGDGRKGAWHLLPK